MKKLESVMRRTLLLRGGEGVYAEPVIIAQFDTPELETLKNKLLSSGLQLVGEQTSRTASGAV